MATNDDQQVRNWRGDRYSPDLGEQLLWQLNQIRGAVVALALFFIVGLAILFVLNVAAVSST